LDRGILAQTVKEEKDISSESNSLGSRQDKLKVIGFHKHYIIITQQNMTKVSLDPNYRPPLAKTNY